MTPARLAAVLAATALSVTAATGCAPIPQAPVPQQSPTVPSASSEPMPDPTLDPTPSASPSASPTVEATPSNPSSPPSTGQPFAVRKGTIDSKRIRATLYPVVRTGRTSTVNLLLEEIKPSPMGFRILWSMSDRNKEVASNDPTAVDGLRMVDAKHKMAYLPATTGDGDCLCSPSSNNVTNNYREVMVTVIFAAPPPSTRVVDVVIPIFGTVSDVPVV